MKNLSYSLAGSTRVISMEGVGDMFSSSLTSFGGAGSGSIYPLCSCVKSGWARREICRMEMWFLSWMRTPPEELAYGTNNSDFPRKGRISQSGPSEDQLDDPDQAHNQVVPFGIYRWRDVNLYALCETLYRTCLKQEY